MADDRSSPPTAEPRAAARAVPGDPASIVVGERLLDDLRTLRSFGATGTGVVRPSLSEVDLAARRWLRDRMADAGLDATIDGVGNVVGRSTRPGPALLLGSHSDTQPTGGWLDGAYGVICGLEVARALGERPDTADLAVDVVAWVDEEATYLGCLGSRRFCGLLDDDEIERASNADGVRLVDALAAAGLDGIGARHEPDRHIGYLEAHIEQGANLEREGDRLGVVTTIVGTRTLDVTFTGQQNHAGTTPMPLRRDAGMALVRFAAEADRAIGELRGPRTVWTVGRIDLHPGAPSIIPGRGVLSLQYRDPDADRLVAIDAAVERVAVETTAATGVEVEVTSPGRPIEPVAMDPGLIAHLQRAAEATAPGQAVAMPSAAVHDAMFVAEVMPAGMLFVPSIDGISHDFAEDTADDDLVLGAEALAQAAAGILRDHRG
ncbi:MAG: hydantoinase/carbamoylase family amidase [Actinomycetota bacterium]